MTSHQFTIRLTSDAEPGTGLGGEVINELIPRDHCRRAILRASHIKGLMRAALQEIADSRAWTGDIVSAVFGSPDESRPGVDAVVSLSDAVAPAASKVRLVTRTAVEESGVAKDQTLRTTEFIAVGTTFAGEIQANVVVGCVGDLAWRLALLAIPAVGGNRNRGCGRCVVSIAGEDRSPGHVLRELDALMQKPAGTDRAAWTPAVREAGPRSLSSESVVLRLLFRARTPVCCPDIPDKTNVISTGFSIPASAVQGMVLNRINREDPSLATLLFENPCFRAWPLQPCEPAASPQELLPDDLPTAIRVSLTHRVAKLSTPEGLQERHFFDEALDAEPYDWTTVADGAPLKASDGVLLRWPTGEVRLWKETAMPHVITSHGVHSDPQTESGRNLFTVDAMAPMVWRGLAVMPRDAAEFFLASLQHNRRVAVGKSRSVRGSGDLVASIVEGLPDEWRTHTDRTVLVVQSPLLLPDQPGEHRSAEEELEQLARTWTHRCGLPAPENRTWANVGLRFGWNRHGAGLQRACRVVLPGSVVTFSRRLDEAGLAAALRSNGLGGGRERGFGAVCVHPGKAVRLYDAAPQIRTVDGEASGQLRDAVQLILDIHRSAHRLPSPSQIRAVQQRLVKAGAEPTLKYLKHQTERTSRIWFTWEPIYKQMDQLLNKYAPQIAARAMEVLADLAIVDQKKGERE